MARALKKRRNLFGFGKKETYHARIVRTGGTKPRVIRKAVRYKGVRIIPALHGEYTTSIDRDSRFDDLKTAKVFVDSWQKGRANPKNGPAKTASGHSLDIVIQPSKRKAGSWDLFVGGIHRITKKTKRGAEGYARRILKANSRSVKAKKPTARLLQGRAKRTQSVKGFKRNSGYWRAKQGAGEARVYQTPSKSTGKDYIIEVMSPLGYEELRAKDFDQAKAIARQKLHETASNPDPSLVPGADYADTLTKAGRRFVKGVKHDASKLVKKLKKKLGRKKNPIEVAARRFEEFHGLPVNETMVLESKIHRHSVTYGIGQLVCLNVVDANGKQLPPLIAPGFKYSGGPLKDVYLQFDGEKVLSPEQADAEGFWDFNPKTPAEKIVWLTCGEDNKQLLLSGGDQSLDLKALGFIERDYHDHMLIGTIVRVWYRTKKKFEGDEEVDFHHTFGAEGSRGIMPVLNYRPKDPSLEIVGGRYEIALPDKSLGGVSPGVVG